jgi:hypothetical protein
VLLGIAGARRSGSRLLFVGTLLFTVADLALFAVAGRPWS